MINWKYEWCKCCERPNKIGFSVSDEDWKKIVGDPNCVLCYNCFEQKSYDKGIPFTLIDEFFPITRVEGCINKTERFIKEKGYKIIWK